MCDLAKIIGQVFLVMIFAGIFAAPIFGETLEEYVANVKVARVASQDLESYYFDVLDGEEFDQNTEDVHLADLRDSFETKGLVSTGNNEIEVSNQWFTDYLDQIAASDDIKEKQWMAAEISYRLHAIENAATELVNAKASGPSKDERKQKAAEILNRPEFQPPAPEEKSIAETWWERFRNWLSSLFENQEKPEAPKVTGMPNLAFFLQILIFALIIGGLIFLAVRFLPRFFPELRRKKKKKKDRVVLGEEIAADVSAFDIFSEAEALARSGDLRMAIRKGYIATLCELDDRNLIGLAKHKTNRDYLRDLKKQRELQKTLSGMTGVFEHTWYGEREAKETDWEAFRNGYETAVKVPVN